MSHIKNDSLEPDIKVLKLTKVLSEMDEALNSTLHPRKTKVNKHSDTFQNNFNIKLSTELEDTFGFILTSLQWTNQLFI